MIFLKGKRFFFDFYGWWFFKAGDLKYLKNSRIGIPNGMPKFSEFKKTFIIKILFISIYSMTFF